MEDTRVGNNGCTEKEKPTHPSLRPPPHGYPPYEASPPSWILLDLHAYIADRENATSAWSKMSNGKAIRVTLCTVPPPLVSYICVWCPDAEIAMEPTIEATEADLVLFRVSLRGRRHQGDYFVYKAARIQQGRPSLQLLQDPKPFLPERYNFTLLPHRNTNADQPGDDGHYCIAVLNQFRGSGPGDFKLQLFDSMNGTWSSSVPVSLGDVCCHITSKVIALGGGTGLVGFVDPWRGIIVCDVLGRKPARYLQLPSPLVTLDKFRDEPQLSRDNALVDGRLTVVELSPIVNEQGSISDYWSWQISSWSRVVVSDHWEEDWQMDYITQSPSISIDSNTDGVELLLNQQHNDGTRQPALGKLYIAHPTLSLSDNGVVYIMGKVNRRDKKALVLAIDMRISKLQGVALFDAERMLGVTFGYTYTQSWISGCFDVAPSGSSFSLPAHG